MTAAKLTDSNAATDNGTVLVVDDSRSVRSALQTELEHAGYQVLQAEDGKEALNLVYKEKLDLVLLDLVMPGLDGLAVLNIIRQSFQEYELPIIILTSRDNPAEVACALEQGASDFLTKPPDVNVLMARIATQVHRKQADEQLRQSREYLELQVKKRTSELQQTVDKLNKEAILRIASEDKVRVLGRAVEQSPVSVIITNTDGVIEYVNQITCGMAGFSKEQLIGKPALAVRGQDTADEEFAEFCLMVTQGKDWQGEWQSRTSTGRPYWERVAMSPVTDINGKVAHILILKEDITTTKDYEARLKHQASHDALTRLPNRVLAYDRLHKALQNSMRDHSCIVVMFLDLDRFKDINDTLGHAAGDQLIVKIAKRLKSCFRDNDTVARLSGDEFLCLFTDDSAGTNSVRLVTRVLNRISAPLIIEGVELVPTASIGLASSFKDGKDADELLRRADVAMYQSKNAGRNQFQFFDESMTKGVARRMEITSALTSALSKNELQMVYQPILVSESGEPYALEALMRWQHAKLGPIGPDEFIPIAESSGLIHEIGTWSIEESLKLLASLRSSQYPDLKMAINVSPRQFRADYPLASILDRITQRCKLPTNAVELEVTEGLFLDPDEATLTILDDLRQAGYLLSMDDFGTGYAALSNLITFKFDVVKIDRLFILDVLLDSNKFELVQAIIVMAKKLNLKVIAEGVEDAAIHKFLVGSQCDMVQGYHFSRPVAGGEIADLLPGFRQSLKSMSA